ncbi:hypothetical protein [Candidatus Magnetominusculus dajiuhuensis]|uniref:hypothetical protein n=1 Tax=Candidatus Magnetominusculus dajiuhuensis TaxID=3137712 RepID=UPI003B435227
MKRSLVYVLALAVMLTAIGLWGINSGSRPADAADTVTYWLPYLTTDSSAPVYCILSNMGTQSGGSGSSIDDNITTMRFTVMSNAAGNPSGNSSPAFGTAARVPFGKSRLLTFSGQQITADGMQVIDLTNDTGTGTLSSYGGRLDLISANTGGASNLSLPGLHAFATARSAFNCSTIGMSCFQGTTTPKRSLVGYTCSDSGLFNNIGSVGGVYSY